LKALRAVSIAVGLPWTFLICFMCLALWRACQYEMGDRKWGNGFKSSILDFGITVMNPGPMRGKFGFNFRLGSFDITRFLWFWLNLFCPVISTYKIMDRKERLRTGMGRVKIVMLTVVAGVLFYSWFLFICLDHIKMDSDFGGYWQYGSAETNTLKKVSTRYGVFYGWAERGYHGQTLKTWNASTVDPVKESVGLTYYPDHGEDFAVGGSIGTNGVLGVFGWFFYCIFIALITWLRGTVRDMYGYHGNIVEDFLASFFLFPTVLTQVVETLDKEHLPVSDDQPLESESTPMAAVVGVPEIGEVENI